MPSTQSRSSQTKRSPTKGQQVKKGAPTAKAPQRVAAAPTPKPKAKPVQQAKPAVSGARQVVMKKKPPRHKPAPAVAPVASAKPVEEVKAMPQMEALAAQMDAALHDPSVKSIHIDAAIHVDVVRDQKPTVEHVQEVDMKGKLADRVESIAAATVVETKIEVDVEETKVVYPPRTDRRLDERPKPKYVLTPEAVAATMPSSNWLERILRDNMARGGSDRDRRRV